MRRELGGDLCQARGALLTWQLLGHHLTERLFDRIEDTRKELNARADREHETDGEWADYWAKMADEWYAPFLHLEAPNRIRLECGHGEFPNNGMASILFGLTDQWEIVTELQGIAGASMLTVHMSTIPRESDYFAKRAARSALAMIWPYCDPLGPVKRPVGANR